MRAVLCHDLIRSYTWLGGRRDRQPWATWGRNKPERRVGRGYPFRDEPTAHTGSGGRPRPALLTLLPLLIAATCGPEPQSLPMVEGSGELKPPSSFAALWYEMENCTGRRKDFRVVRWYVVPTADWAGFECEAPEGCNGQYHKGTIYLADHKVQSKDTVRHEILHALGLFHEDAEFWRCLGKPMPDRYKRQRRGAP